MVPAAAWRGEQMVPIALMSCNHPSFSASTRFPGASIFDLRAFIFRYKVPGSSRAAAVLRRAAVALSAADHQLFHALSDMGLPPSGRGPEFGRQVVEPDHASAVEDERLFEDASSPRTFPGIRIP